MIAVDQPDRAGPLLLHRSQEQARCVDVFGRRHTTDGAVCPPEVKGKRALPLGDLPGQFRRSVPVQVQGHRVHPGGEDLQVPGSVEPVVIIGVNAGAVPVGPQQKAIVPQNTGAGGKGGGFRVIGALVRAAVQAGKSDPPGARAQKSAIDQALRCNVEPDDGVVF